MTAADVAATAAEALRLASVDPDRGRDLAWQVHRDAVMDADWETASRAARAAGLAALNLRDLPGARSALSRAVSAAGRARSVELAAEARMTLAATYLVGGAPGRAIRFVEAALDGLEGPAAARARVQRGTILQSLGRLDEALAEFRTALPVLRRDHDVEWQGRALSNRSVLLTTRRSFGAAEADLRAAMTLFRDHQMDLQAAYATQNLGCLKASQGDVVQALALFDQAAQSYRRLGVEVGSLLVDRGELLLSVRLVEEAVATAGDAVAVLRSQHRLGELPAAHLLHSTALLVAGQPQPALAAARSASDAFGRLDRHAGAVLARFAQYQAQLEIDPALVPPAKLRAVADELFRHGWRVPALEARVLAGRLSIIAGDRERAAIDLVQAGRARLTGPADCRGRAWLAEGLLRGAQGNPRGAARAFRAGLRVLEEQQATLGATELRAHVSVYRGALARSGLRLAMAQRSARQALSWTECGRVSALMVRPPRPPADGTLALTLADLRTTVQELEERLARGEPAADLVQRQVRLERAISERQRRLPPTDRAATVRPAQVSAILDRLDDRALISYFELDDVLHAVTACAGRVRLHRLGDIGGLADRIAYLGFTLRRAAQSSATRGTTAVLRALTAGFTDLLLRPLLREVDDRPLVIVPAEPLQSLPWAALEPCLGRPLSVAPSATSWLLADSRGAASRMGASPRVLAVAGPGLPGADTEVTAVAAEYDGPGPTPVVLRGNDATVDALGAANGVAVAHIAAHGKLRSDNPLFSSLQMADGPLTVYDLDRLPRAPEHVVLAACSSARLQPVVGDEVLGFAAALLVQGTRSLVAPVIPIPDATTVPLMIGYHRRLRAGQSPAAALAAAQLTAADDGLAAAATAAAFICLGAG